MNSHTLGPWQRHGSHIYGPDPRRTLIGQFEIHSFELEANARLIAAAPEMLNALKLVEAKYRMHRGNFSLMSKGQENLKEILSFIENLDAVTGHIEHAISKAEGRAHE